MHLVCLRITRPPSRLARSHFRGSHRPRTESAIETEQTRTVVIDHPDAFPQSHSGRLFIDLLGKKSAEQRPRVEVAR